MTAAHVRHRIHLLQELLAHPRASEVERDGARRALLRLLQLHPSHAQDTPALDLHPAPVADVKDAGKLLRAELRARRRVAELAPHRGAEPATDPVADLPEQVKISVRTSRWPVGDLIEVTLSDIPEDLWNITRSRWGVEDVVPTRRLHAAGLELEATCDTLRVDGGDRLEWTVYAVAPGLGRVHMP